MTQDELLNDAEEQLFKLMQAHAIATQRTATSSIMFYRLDSKERRARHWLLDDLNAQIIQNGASVLDWRGPDLTETLRLSVIDKDGWSRRWVDQLRSERQTLNMFAIEIIMQHPTHGFMISADMFNTTGVTYDTRQRYVTLFGLGNNNLAHDDVVLDFEITRTQRIDDQGYLDHVINKNPTMEQVCSGHQVYQYEMVREFCRLAKTAKFPLNHLYQVKEALKRKDVERMLIEVIKKHKG